MWEDSCPRKMGFRDFLGKYIKLFPERVEHYAKNHWALTQDLTRHGQEIANGIYTHPSMLMPFLLMVGIWKNPHEPDLQKTIANMARNNTRSIELTFAEALDIYRRRIKGIEEVPEDADRRLVDSLGKLGGFGRKTGSRKMVSAALRFLDPTKYGTVDYRNWVILSNTEHQFLEESLLRPLGQHIEGSKRIEIGTGKYITYLKTIRKLAKTYGITPAEVDMALFAYSDEIIPFSRENMLPPARTKSDGKALRMMQIIQDVVDSVESLGLHRHANILLSRVQPLARKGDYEGIYHYCKRAVSGKSHVDDMIEKRGGKSLRKVFCKIEEIYQNR